MALSLILISAANAPGVHALAGPIVRTPWLDAWSAPPAAPACNEVSNVLDSHMVLQQAPATAAVWGQACGMLQHATSVTVTVVLEHTGAVLASAKAPIVDGKWKASLPAVAGSMAPYTLTIAGDDGKFSRNLTDVLFGDVNPSARLPHTMPNRWNEVGMSADQYPGMPPDVHSGGPPACGFTPDPNPPGPGFAPCVPTKARGHSVAPRAWLDRSVAAVGPMMPHDAMRCPMCVCHRRTTPRSCRSATDGTRSRA